MVFPTVVPTRFLALTAHLVLVIMSFWVRVSVSLSKLTRRKDGRSVCLYMLQDQNVVACVSSTAMPGSQEYASKDAQLVHAWNLRIT